MRVPFDVPDIPTWNRMPRYQQWAVKRWFGSRRGWNNVVTAVKHGDRTLVIRICEEVGGRAHVGHNAAWDQVCYREELW